MMRYIFRLLTIALLLISGTTFVSDMNYSDSQERSHQMTPPESHDTDFLSTDSEHEINDQYISYVNIYTCIAGIQNTFSTSNSTSSLRTQSIDRSLTRLLMLMTQKSDKKYARSLCNTHTKHKYSNSIYRFKSLLI